DGPLGVTDLLWTLAYVSIGVAAFQPSMAAVGDEPPDERNRLTIGHILVLGASVAVGPVMLIAQAGGERRAAITAGATVAIVALVVLRVALLSRSLERALAASRSNEERLERAL